MRKLKAFMSKMPLMMTCGEVEAVLLDYLEGHLSGYALAKFEFHIKVCQECRDYLAAYRKAVSLGGEILGPSNAPAPEGLPEDLVNAILAAKDAETS